MYVSIQDVSAYMHSGMEVLIRGVLSFLEFIMVCLCVYITVRCDIDIIAIKEAGKHYINKGSMYIIS
jgi:hypothetical protein